MPGLVLAMVLLPIARPLRAPDRRAWQTLLFLTGVYAITVLTTPRWYPGYIVGTIFLTLALVWAPAGLGLGAGAGGSAAAVVAGAGVVLVLLAVVLGRAQQVQYADHHYTELDCSSSAKAGRRRPTTSPASSTTSGSGSSAPARSSSASTASTAADLYNHVQYIGVPGPHGAYRLPTSCAQFRRLINAGDYDFLIMSQVHPGLPARPNTGTRSTPGSRTTRR